MLVNVNFLHLIFFFKQIKLICLNKIQIGNIYSILGFHNFFFILIAQRFNFAVMMVVKPKVSFIFKIKVPSKTIFNLILMETINLVKCLKFIKECNFYNFRTKSIKYTVLRSPFIFKNTRDQLFFDSYIGTFLTEFYTTNFLIVDFVEACFFNILKYFFLLDLKGIKKMNLK